MNKSSLNNMALGREECDLNSLDKRLLDRLMQYSLTIGNLNLCEQIFATGRYEFSGKIWSLCPPHILEWVRRAAPHYRMENDEERITVLGDRSVKYEHFEPTPSLVAYMKENVDLRVFVEKLICYPSSDWERWKRPLIEFMPLIGTIDVLPRNFELAKIYLHYHPDQKNGMCSKAFVNSCRVPCDDWQPSDEDHKWKLITMADGDATESILALEDIRQDGDYIFKNCNTEVAIQLAKYVPEYFTARAHGFVYKFILDKQVSDWVEVEDGVFCDQFCSPHFLDISRPKSAMG